MNNDQEYKTKKSSLQNSYYNLSPVFNNDKKKITSKTRNKSLNLHQISELPPINIQHEAIRESKAKLNVINARSKTLEINLKTKKNLINPFPNSRTLKSPKNTKPKDALLRKKPKNKLLEIDTTKSKIGNIIRFPVFAEKVEIGSDVSQESFKPYSPDSRIKNKLPKRSNNKAKDNQYQGGAGDISGWKIKNITGGSFFK